MKSPIQRRIAIAALLLAPALSACGFSVQTDQVYQAAVGVNDRSGTVDILNALIVSGTDGTGTFAGTLVNTNLDSATELTSITGPDVTADLQPVPLESNSATNLADSGAVTINGSKVVPGNFVTLTLVFANGQSTTVSVPVVRDSGDYANVPLPTPSPSRHHAVLAGGSKG